MAEANNRSIQSNRSLGTINPEAVHNNALNNSISKMQYSFSKSPRFQQDKNQQLSPRRRLNTHFYDVPGSLTHRATSLGYGHKVQLSSSKNPTPSPSQYNIGSQFEEKKKKKMGISFGLGRGDVKTNSMFLQGTDKLPAPGTYNPSPKQKHIEYSIRAKFEDKSDQWIKKVPGPGAYQNVEPINKDCKNFVSKYESAKTAKFSILPRLVKDRVSISPGPAQCNPISKTDDNFKEAETKFHAPIRNKFMHSKRKGLTDSTTKVPGPGEYNSFSDFGS